MYRQSNEKVLQLTELITTRNFRDFKYLHVDGYFSLDVVALCHKFQRISSLMAVALSDDTNSQWFRNVFS